MLVVRRLEVVRGFHPLDRVSELAAVSSQSERAEGDEHGAPLPRLVEHRLVGLDLDRAESLHAAEVVHAVHEPIRPQ